MRKNPSENQRPEKHEKPDVVDSGRRKVLHTLGMAGVLAGAMALGAPLSTASAAENHNNDTVRELGLPKHPEILDENEIQLMDTSMNCIFRQFLQPSFFDTALPPGSESEVKNIFGMAVQNFDKLHYEQSENGYVLITKRRSKNASPAIPDNFSIKIKNGIVTNIGKYKVSLKGLEKWEKEWREIQNRITNINNKALNPEAELLSGIEKKWYEFYNMGLPRLLFELLTIKKGGFPLTPEEQEIFDTLTLLLPNHPEQYGEKGKKNQFHVKIKPQDGKTPTPPLAAELVYPKTDEKNPRKTFGVFSFEGYVFRNKNKDDKSGKPNWVKSSPSFADLYRAKTEKQ